MGATAFDIAFEQIRHLAATFKSNEARYLSPDYKEIEARKDFIDKFWIALGWDVNHDREKDPYEQEVSVERSIAGRRADYAFCLAPNFHDVRFIVEAKKPSIDVDTKENYFQTIRYGWNNNTYLAVLTDFETFHIIDCRYEPNLESALNRKIAKYHYSDYTKPDKFAEIYWLFSREAVASGSLEKRAKELPKPRGKAIQRGLFPGGYQSVDQAFLAELDEHRTALARTFKNRNPKLDSETLTELAQRTLDRLVFLRFLEDKGIEGQRLVDRFGEEGSAWGDFVAASRRLDSIYNGIVFRRHDILDATSFEVDDKVFADICESLAHVNSPYDFNAIPIHILGSIYERFLGKVIVATAQRAKVVDKPEVRKAGGVYYTPAHIVRYIAENTVGKLMTGKTPEQIATMRFADIACGSGSFLLGIFDLLLDFHGHYYNENPRKARKGDCIERDGKLYLSLHKKREILLNNIYGVDIDPQAVEVCQFSLYLKLLQDETEASTHQYLLDFAHADRMQRLLPDLGKNIVCGNSLIGRDILDGQLFPGDEERALNPMDFEDAFPEVMKLGGFNAIIGNPPYSLVGAERSIQHRYFTSGKYKLTSYKTNLYLLFVEKALNLVTRNNGSIGYIIPKSLAFNTYFESTRQQLLEEFALPLLVEIREKVFADAEVGDSLLFFADRAFEPLKSQVIYRITNNVGPTQKLFQEYKSTNAQLLAREGAYFRPSELQLKEKTVRLDTLWKVSNGLNPGNVRHILFANRKKTSKHRPLLLGRDLHRYDIAWSGTWVNYDPDLKSKIKLTDTKSKTGMTAQKKIDFALRSPEIYSANKIIVRKTSDRLIACYDAEGYYFDSLAYGIHALPTTRESPLFLLGLLNSKLIDRIHEDLSQNKDKVFAKVLGTNLNRLPMPILDMSKHIDKLRHDEVVTKVEAMLQAKQQLARAQTDRNKTYYENKCANLNRQIDKLVYNLYGLTQEEIAIVEQSSTE